MEKFMKLVEKRKYMRAVKYFIKIKDCGDEKHTVYLIRNWGGNINIELLDMIRMYHTCYCLNTEICDSAIFFGVREVIDYMIAQGGKQHVIKSCVSYNNKEILNSIGNIGDRELFESICEADNVDMFIYMNRPLPPDWERIVTNNGAFSVFTHIVDGMELTADLICKFSNNGYMVKYLHMRGCPWDERMYEGCESTRRYAALKKCPIGDNTIEHLKNVGDWETLYVCQRNIAE